MVKKQSKKEIKIEEVIPISRCVGKKEAQNALKAASNEENLIGEGNDGKVYKFKKNLCVKKVYDGFDSELNGFLILNNAINCGLDSDFFKKGLYSFITNEYDNEGYIVSTMLEGDIIYNLPYPVITRKHFQNIFRIIFNLDIGTLEKENLNQYYTYIHFDLSPMNILFSENSAGIIDFKELKKENLDIYMSKYSDSLYNYKFNILDDAASLPCNMRLFEICFLWLYLLWITYKYNNEDSDINLKLRQKIFDDYLISKGEHLLNLSKKHREFSLTRYWGSSLMNEMSQTELVYSRLLMPKNRVISEDIKLAEIYKIQLSNFYFQVFCHPTGLLKLFSPDFLRNYKKKAGEYFEAALKKAEEDEDTDKIVYFKSCQKFYDKFADINDIEIDENTEVDDSVLTLNDILLPKDAENVI